MPELTCGSAGLTYRADHGTHFPLFLDAASTSKFTMLHAHVNLQLPDESIISLQRADQRASPTSTQARYFHPNYMLKLSADGDASRREACALRLMEGEAVPHVVCSAGSALLLNNVGEPLGVHNLPLDYGQQAASIIRAMRVRGIRHNDIWKDDARMQTKFATELLVDKSGRLSLVDFNTATINGSYACASGMRTTALDAEEDFRFKPSIDEDVLHVLNALHAVNRTFERYKAEGLPRARHGICAFSDFLRRQIVGEPVHELGCSRAQDEWTRDGAFVLGGSNDTSTDEHGVGSGGGSSSNLPSRPLHLPLAVDIRRCLELCRRCHACHTISVSSRRDACLWFRENATSASPCRLVDARAGMLQTARKGLRGGGSIHLDDFVTFEVGPSTRHHSPPPLPPPRAPMNLYEAAAAAFAAAAPSKHIKLVPCPISGPYAAPWHKGAQVCQLPTTGTCNATFQLQRRLSAHGKCFPDGDPLVGSHIMWGGYGCYPNENRIWVTNRCAGKFVCENGRTLLCGSSANNSRVECPCSSSP